VTEAILFWLLAALAFLGAIVVVVTRDVMRLALGLGAFLLAVAGFFALFGFGFLALAEVFVYVGGVLVLVLFAIMLVHRTPDGSPRLESRHDPLAAVASIGVGLLLALLLRPSAVGLVSAKGAGVDTLGKVLLGSMLPQFELAGLLLLAALVAVVAIAGGERE
jgi:NADH-quinone oxidoreductase subunit J